MRNVSQPINKTAWTFGLVALTVAGCQTPQPSELDRALTALRANQYDEAGAAADTYLLKDTTGSRAAEAYYLKGRAIEQSPNKSVEDARSHLQQARLAYINALKAGPADKNMQGMIRSAIANVAYWQDDYSTAVEQWTTAFGMLSDADTRSRALLRTGISQQRLGQFDAADRTFAMVVQQFPGSDPANRAQSRIGARAFNVQLTFSQPTLAANAAANLLKMGLPINRVPSPNGQSIVLVGPFSAYAQASAAKSRVGSQYSMPQIVP